MQDYRQLNLWAGEWICSICGAGIQESARMRPGMALRPAEYLGSGQWLCGGVGGCAECKRQLEDKEIA